MVQAVQLQQDLDVESDVGDNDIVTLDARFVAPSRGPSGSSGPSGGPSGGPATQRLLVDLSNCVSVTDMPSCKMKVECKVIMLPVLGQTCAPRDPNDIIKREDVPTSKPLLLQSETCTQAKQMVLLKPSGEVKKGIRFPINNTGYEAYFKMVEGGATNLVGKRNGHGRIDLKCGSAADFEFGFVRSRTDIRVPMDHVALTFYDFHQGQQSVEACASRVFIQKDAELALNTNPGCVKVNSCERRENHESADDPQHRTTFLWSGEKKLRFRLAADGCSDASEKSFSFAFDPSGACNGAVDVLSESWRPRTCCDVGDCDKTLHVSKSTHR